MYAASTATLQLSQVCKPATLCCQRQRKMPKIRVPSCTAVSSLGETSWKISSTNACESKPSVIATPTATSFWRLPGSKMARSASCCALESHSTSFLESLSAWSLHQSPTGASQPAQPLRDCFESPVAFISARIEQHNVEFTSASSGVPRPKM